MKPKREDNNATFLCRINNQAMRKGETLTASIILNVNYFPRVTVGPNNPLKVTVNSTAVLVCKVDTEPMVSMIHWYNGGIMVIWSA